MTSRENWKPIDHYQEITDLVIKSMESERERWTGGLPWDKNIAMPTGPINAATNRHYRGINQLTLGILNPLVFTTGDPRFCSYKQAVDMGWQVKKGSKASHAVFYKPLDLEKDGYPVFDGNGDQKKSFVLRSYPVFHLSQIEGAPIYEQPTLKDAPWRTIEAADIILKESRANIRHGGDRAYYSPTTDHIQLPPINSFAGPEEHATVALHELGHWTGASTRLNRELNGKSSKSSYAFEELIAELTSMFVSSATGIPLKMPRHLDYLDSWVSVLKNDKRAIFMAASSATKASNLILGFHPDYAARLAAENAADAAHHQGLPTPSISAQTPAPGTIAPPAPAVIKAMELASNNINGFMQLPQNLRHQAEAYAKSSGSPESQVALGNIEGAYRQFSGKREPAASMAMRM